MSHTHPIAHANRRAWSCLAMLVFAALVLVFGFAVSDPAPATEAGVMTKPAPAHDGPIAVDVWPLPDDLFEQLGSLSDPTSAAERRDLGPHLRTGSRAFEDDAQDRGGDVRRVVLNDVGERVRGMMNQAPPAGGVSATSLQLANQTVDDALIKLSGFASAGVPESGPSSTVVIPTPSTALTMLGLLSLLGVRRPGAIRGR